MKNLDRFSDVGLLLLRLVFGFRLIYGTVDNIISYERMLEFRDFLEAEGFPLPLISAFVSVILQFTAGLSWIIGYKTKLFSMLMVLNFIIAILFVHVGDSYINTAPAIHMLVVAIFLLTNGNGKYSLDKD